MTKFARSPTTTNLSGEVDVLPQEAVALGQLDGVGRADRRAHRLQDRLSAQRQATTTTTNNNGTVSKDRTTTCHDTQQE